MKTKPRSPSVMRISQKFIAFPVFNWMRFIDWGAESLLFIAIFKGINGSKLSRATLLSNRIFKSSEEIVNER